MEIFPRKMKTLAKNTCVLQQFVAMHFDSLCLIIKDINPNIRGSANAKWPQCVAQVLIPNQTDSYVRCCATSCATNVPHTIVSLGSVALRVFIRMTLTYLWFHAGLWSPLLSAGPALPGTALLTTFITAARTMHSNVTAMVIYIQLAYDGDSSKRTNCNWALH